LKTDILAQVAHELRQPLSAMTMAVGLIEQQPGESARQRALGVVARQTDQLRRLVDDLLDASRISRREIRLHKSQVDLCEVAEDSLHMVANDIAARRVGVASSLPQCPVHVTADPTRIRQVFSNLLSNAVKFTPEGGRIGLSVERTPSQVVIRVRDTGRGIAPDRLTDIFEMFHKGDGDGAGLGIGLAVVKGLVELHGGSVAAYSDGPEHGSEFVVTLPAAAQTAA
jgi:signal transduction histidine kinase